MKTASFHFDLPAGTPGPDGSLLLNVPTLSAYAIEYSEFTPPPNFDTGYYTLVQDRDFHIEGDNIVWRHPPELSIGTCRLVIHYHGIRDYLALFPQITDAETRGRIAKFYEEASIAFDHGAWLFFALMAGAVYESLLCWELSDPNAKFYRLIDDAATAGLVDEKDKVSLEQARRNRNLVHASKANETYISRASAMDMRSVMDRMIRRFSKKEHG